MTAHIMSIWSYNIRFSISREPQLVSFVRRTSSPFGHSGSLFVDERLPTLPFWSRSLSVFWSICGGCIIRSVLLAFGFVIFGTPKIVVRCYLAMVLRGLRLRGWALSARV